MRIWTSTSERQGARKGALRGIGKLKGMILGGGGGGDDDDDKSPFGRKKKRSKDKDKDTRGGLNSKERA